MKSLAKKEISELTVLFGPILAIATLIWFGTFKLEDVLLAPRDEPLVLAIAISAGAGLLVAQAQFHGERVRKTLGFLVHRGPGVAGCFRTKVLIGATGSMLIGLLPPLLFALVQAFVLGNGPVIHWERVGEFALVSTAGPGAYAATVLAQSLRRGLFAEHVMSLIGIGGLLLISMSLRLLVPGQRESLLGFAAVHAAAAVILIPLASRIFATWPDRDLPLAATHHALLFVVAAILWIPVPLVLIGGLQGWIGSACVKGSPVILQDLSNKEFMLAVREEDGRFERLEGGRRVPDDRLESFNGWTPKDGSIQLVHGMEWSAMDAKDSDELRSYPRGRPGAWEWIALSDQSRYDSPHGRFKVSAWLDRSAGALRLFALGARWAGEEPMQLEPSQSPPGVPCELVIRKSQGNGCFSAATVVLNTRLPHPLVGLDGEEFLVVWRRRHSVPDCIADPEDHTLWKFDAYDFGNPLEQIEMPAGDRFVGVETRTYRVGEVRVGQYVDAWRRLVRGEKGYYEWIGTKLSPLDTSDEVDSILASDETEKLVELRTVATDPDPLAPRVEVRDERAGTVLFSHVFEPVSASAKLAGILLHPAALLRPPVLAVASFFRDTGGIPPRISRSNAFFDPLLANRSRPWLLAAILLFAGALAASATRRARERQAATSVVVLGVLLIVVLGVSGYLLAGLLEGRRARRKVAAPEPRAEPVVLIQSA